MTDRDIALIDELRAGTEYSFVESKTNAAQATKVINGALKASLIKPAESDRPRAGYVPWWA